MRRLDDKIKSIEHATESIEAARNSNQVIVWTNGCFDILHAGHVNYLQQARLLGDLLVLGINADASVKLLKGKQRPFVPLAARMQIVAALEAVDMVVAFEDETPIQPILTLQPDIIVKGGDYQAQDVVGGTEARAWGGRVEIIPFVQGWSTTKIAAELAKPSANASENADKCSTDS